jgi:hypothetical protein
MPTLIVMGRQPIFVTLLYSILRKCKKASADEGSIQIISRENFKRPYQMWSFELGQSEQPDEANATAHNEETRQEPLKEAPKDNDARKKEVAERITKLVEKFARVLLRKEAEGKERNETRQEPQKEAQKEVQKEVQKDSDKMDASNEVSKRMAALVEQYMQMLRGEFEAANQLQKERNEEMRQELLEEARKDTNKQDVTKIAKLFEKYERMLLEEFDAAEQLRKERTEKMRRELLRGARKDIEKMVANEEVTKKMAKLFEKYEQMMQEELEAIEQLRKERNEKMREELLEEARKDINKMVANGTLTKKLVEKYERMLREDFEAVGQLRKEHNDEMMQELVKEARQVIDKMVASMEGDKKMAGKYQWMLQEGFEAIEQLRKERNVELRQELLEEVRKGINKADAIREGAKKMAGLAEKYEQRLQEEFEGIEQLRMERNEKTRQELLKETRKTIDKTDAREGAKKMAELFEKYERTLQEEYEAIEQLRKERNEKMRQELLKESRNKTNAKMAELVEKYERMLGEDFEAIGELRKECHEEAGQKLLKEAKLRR